MKNRIISALLLLVVIIGFSGVASATTHKELVKEAWDEEVLVSPAWNETIPAVYEEQVTKIINYARYVLPIKDAANLEKTIKNAELVKADNNYTRYIIEQRYETVQIGKRSVDYRWYKVTFYGQILITPEQIIEHPAVYETIHHPAIYKDVKDPVVPPVKPPVKETQVVEEPNTVDIPVTGGSLNFLYIALILVLAGMFTAYKLRE